MQRRVAPAVNDAVEAKYRATRVLVVINKIVAVIFVAAGFVAAAAAQLGGASRLIGFGIFLFGLVLALFSWAAAEAFQIGLDIEEHLRASRQMTKELLRRRDRESQSVGV